MKSIKIYEEDVLRIIMMLASPSFSPSSGSETTELTYKTVNPSWLGSTQYYFARTKDSHNTQEDAETWLGFEFRSHEFFTSLDSASAITQIGALNSSQGPIYFALFTIIKDTDEPGRIFPPTLENPIEFLHNKPSHAGQEKKLTRKDKKMVAIGKCPKCSKLVKTQRYKVKPCMNVTCTCGKRSTYTVNVDETIKKLQPWWKIF